MTGAVGIPTIRNTLHSVSFWITVIFWGTYVVVFSTDIAFAPILATIAFAALQALIVAHCTFKTIIAFCPDGRFLHTIRRVHADYAPLIQTRKRALGIVAGLHALASINTMSSMLFRECLTSVRARLTWQRQRSSHTLRLQPFLH